MKLIESTVFENLRLGSKRAIFASGFQKLAKLTIFGTFDEFLSTHNANVES